MIEGDEEQLCVFLDNSYLVLVLSRSYVGRKLLLILEHAFLDAGPLSGVAQVTTGIMGYSSTSTDRRMISGLICTFDSTWTPGTSDLTL